MATGHAGHGALNLGLKACSWNRACPESPPGNLQEGLLQYQAAAELCPTYAPAFYNIGVVYSQLRQVRKGCQR